MKAITPEAEMLLRYAKDAIEALKEVEGTPVGKEYFISDQPTSLWFKYELEKAIRKVFVDE